MNNKLILDGHKLQWHHERVNQWLDNQHIPPITIDCALTRRCSYNCSYCLRATTKILMGDYTWKEIRDVVVGDDVMGFDEHSKGEHLRARYYPTKVLKTFRRYARLHRLCNDETKDRLFITKEHPVLCSGHRWRKPQTFKEASIRFFCTPYETNFPESFDYKLGYLKGLLEGDGTFGRYRDKRDSTDRLCHKFKLDLIDQEPLARASRYIKDLFCFDVSHPKNPQIITKDSKYEVEHLRSGIQWKEKTEIKSFHFARGYLGGIFDAEGSLSVVLRISNKTDLDTVGENIKNALDVCKFNYTKEDSGFRLKGGFSEIAKFLGQTKPAIKRKIKKLHNKRIPSTLNVYHTSQGCKNEDVYNLETESGTYVANGFCVHNCYSKVQQNEGQDLSEYAIYRFLDDAAEIGVKAISFVSDGESTLSPHLQNAVLKCAVNGLDVALGSNGYLLTEDKLEAILPYLTYLRFNISAAHQDRYCEIHGVSKKCYAGVISNIRKAVQIKKENNLDVTIGTQMVLLPSFADQILPLTTLSWDMGVDYFVIKHCSDDEFGNLGVDYSKYKKLTDLLNEAEAASTSDFQVSAKWSKIMSNGKRNYSKCFGPAFIMQFSGSGLVAPCGMLFNDRHKSKYHIGNLENKGLKEIWESDRYREVLDRICSDKFDARKDCGSLCLQHKCNEFLNDLDGWLKPMKGEKPQHINFT